MTGKVIIVLFSCLSKCRGRLDTVSLVKFAAGCRWLVAFLYAMEWRINDGAYGASVPGPLRLMGLYNVKLKIIWWFVIKRNLIQKTVFLIIRGRAPKMHHAPIRKMHPWVYIPFVQHLNQTVTCFHLWFLDPLSAQMNLWIYVHMKRTFNKFLGGFNLFCCHLNFKKKYVYTSLCNFCAFSCRISVPS